MNNETMSIVDELVQKLAGILPEWNVRQVGNKIMEASQFMTETERASFYNVLTLVIVRHKCQSHDCGCPDCPNSFYNYEEVVQDGFDVNSQVKVEVKKEIPTTSSDAYVPSTFDVAWRKAAIEEFRKNDKYASMPVPTLVSMVLASRGAQPSNYSKMEAAFKNYLHTPDGESWFQITRGRGGGVRVRHAYRDETWQ